MYSTGRVDCQNTANENDSAQSISGSTERGAYDNYTWLNYSTRNANNTVESSRCDRTVSVDNGADARYDVQFNDNDVFNHLNWKGPVLEANGRSRM